MRLGIYGGSFDPIHYGHLLLAEQCREFARLDAVWFVPAWQSPHKLDQPPASGDARLNMIRLAIGGHPNFDVAEIEIARGEVSYTVDTLRHIRTLQPDAELFLLMGGDTLADLPKWREPEAICQLASPLVVHRADAPAPDRALVQDVATKTQLESWDSLIVPMPSVDLSSSEIRRRVSLGHSIRFMTPRAVEKLIQTQALYGTATADDATGVADSASQSG